MKIECKLSKKNFTTQDNQVREYYVLVVPIYGNEEIEIPIKGDKAKLIMLSHQLNK